MKELRGIHWQYRALLPLAIRTAGGASGAGLMASLDCCNGKGVS